MKQSLGEQQVSPDLLTKVAPDVAGPQGQQQLMAKQMAAKKFQGILDMALKTASSKLGGSSSTRIKDVDTASKKIGQKRIEDGNSDYGINDLRDFLGGRVVVDKDKIPQAKDEIHAMAKAGLFKIDKEEKRNVGTYNAYHYDVKLPTGEMAEIQIHTKKSEAASVANHDIRAQLGEDPPDAWKAVQQKQADLIEKMPGDKAKFVTQALQKLHQMNDNKPIPAQLTAQIVKGVN